MPVQSTLGRPSFEQYREQMKCFSSRPTNAKKADNTVEVQIGNIKTRALIDTGAEASVISQSILECLNPKIHRENYNPPDFPAMLAFGGESHPTLGQTELNIVIGDYVLSHSFHIFAHLHFPLIIGLDIMYKHNAQLSIENNNLILQLGTPSVQVAACTQQNSALLRPIKDVTIPAHHESLIPLKAPTSFCHSMALIEPKECLYKMKLAGARSIVNVPGNRYIVCRVMNPTNQDVKLKSRTVVASLSRLSPADIAAQIPQTNAIKAQAPTIAATGIDNTDYVAKAKELNIDLDDSLLNEPQKTELLTLIGQYRDCFAMSLDEIGKAEN